MMKYLPKEVPLVEAYQIASEWMRKAWRREDEPPEEIELVTVLKRVECSHQNRVIQRRLSERTLETDKRALSLLRLWIELKTITKLDNESVDAFIWWLEFDRRMKPSTVNLILRHLSGQWKKERVTFNPFTGRQIPIKDDLKRDYTLDEIKLIRENLHSVDKELRIYIELLRLTGARSGAIYKLSPSDVDISQKVIRIPASKRESYFFPITGDLELIVRQFKGWSHRRRWYLQGLRSFVDGLGIQIEMPGHGFRHTLATRLAAQGEHPSVIAAMLGQRSLATQRIYQHIRVHEQRAAIERLHASTIHHDESL